MLVFELQEEEDIFVMGPPRPTWPSSTAWLGVQMRAMSDEEREAPERIGTSLYAQRDEALRRYIAAVGDPVDSQTRGLALSRISDILHSIFEEGGAAGGLQICPQLWSQEPVARVPPSGFSPGRNKIMAGAEVVEVREHPDHWAQLRVNELLGRERINRPYWPPSSWRSWQWSWWSSWHDGWRRGPIGTIDALSAQKLIDTELCPMIWMFSNLHDLCSSHDLVSPRGKP
jgi:hypothetical protein